MDSLYIVTISIFFILILLSAYRSSGGLLTISFLVMLYIIFLYIGSIGYYFEYGHYTLVYIFIIGVFYLLGIKFANKYQHFKPQAFQGISPNIYVPLHSTLIKYALILSVLLVICLAIYRFKVYGITLLEKSWYNAEVQSAKGAFDKLLFASSITSLALIGMIFWGLYKSERKGVFKILAFFSFVTYILFQTFEGGKSTAIMPFLMIGMAFFYFDRRTPQKFLVVTTVMVLLMGTFLGSYWIKVFSIREIFLLFYSRITELSVLHFDFLIYEWAEKYPYQYGNTILLEIHRFIAQVTPIAKQPLFNELIGNLRGGQPLSRVTGISPELSIFGMGFANFGYLGALFTAFLFGYTLQRINIYALTCKSLNIFVFAILTYFIYSLLGLARTGNLLIPFQDFLIKTIPAILMIMIIYFIIAIPFPTTLKWKKLRAVTS